METGNKFALILILALSSHLLYAAQAVCVPRTFKYLEPSSSSPAPAPLNQSQPQPKPTPSPPKAAPLNQSQPEPKPTPSPPKAPSMPETTPSTPSTSAPKQESSVPTIGLTLPGSEIKKACEATDYPLLCMAHVPAFLQGKFDEKSIVIAAVKAVLNHTRVVKELANKITADPKTPTDIVEGTDYCKENYDTSIFNLEQVIEKDIPKHDRGSVQSMLSGCIGDIATCGDTWGEVTTSPNPLAAMGDIIKQLCIVALTITARLNW